MFVRLKRKGTMDREFKSKVDWWFQLILLIMALVTVLLFVKGGRPSEMIIMLLGTLLCVHMLLTTRYTITADGWLLAHCSFFPVKRIDIREITAIEVSAMPVSSYALSLDRLILYKGGQQWLLVSPRNKQEFVRLLRKFNPAIQIKDPIF